MLPAQLVLHTSELINYVYTSLMATDDKISHTFATCSLSSLVAKWKLIEAIIIYNVRVSAHTAMANVVSLDVIETTPTFVK